MIIVSQNKKNIVNFDSIFMVDAAPGTVMRETEIQNLLLWCRQP